MNAPTLMLSDKDGTVHDLAARKGKWTLVYFYPKDDTPGCTLEAKAFADAHAKFKKNGIAVFGVSPDSPKKHAKFCEKYGLPFTLLSDEEKTTLKRWGVWQKKKFMGREYMGVMRWSYLIAPDGKVAKAYEDVKPVEHAEEVLADFAALNKKPRG